MKNAVEQLVADHVRVASQYEAVGDAATAAHLRAVANIVASALRGENAGTLYPELTEENKTAIREKAQAVLRAEKKFTIAYDRYSDWQDQAAYEEAASRTINLILRKPREASLLPWTEGINDAVTFMSQYKGD